MDNQFTRLAIRRGKPHQWALMNLRLLENEPGLEMETGRVKLGDGLTHWNDLPYITELPPLIQVRRITEGVMQAKIRQDSAEEIWQFDPPMIERERILETDTGRCKVATHHGLWSEFRYLDEIEKDYLIT